MKFSKLTFSLIAASGLMFAAGCDIDQTQEGDLPDVDLRADAGELPEYELVKTEEGRMPDVDVDVEGGQLPHYDIDGPEVTMGEKEVTVDVPDVDVDVDTERESFTVPTIDVDLPDDDEN
ncbi:MAG: hypothetical protein HKN49_12450, partial [Gammaproteobacteria bacterium]|nr:hypothetical protein [Gammaproteobacteria bacterium]